VLGFLKFSEAFNTGVNTMLKKDMGTVNLFSGAVNALIAPTIDKNFTTCDLLNYGGCAIIVDLGNSGDTLSGSVKIELEVEHSDDDSTWADCANADILDPVTGTNLGTFAVVDAPTEDSAIFRTEYVGGKRYVRLVLNVTGTHTNGTPISVMYARFRPVVVS
jgi:hypothetical protein